MTSVKQCDNAIDATNFCLQQIEESYSKLTDPHEKLCGLQMLLHMRKSSAESIKMANERKTELLNKQKLEKKKIGRPKKVFKPQPEIKYDKEKADKWDMMKVGDLKKAISEHKKQSDETKKAISELKKQLDEQGKYETEWLKMCAENERPKTAEDQERLDKMHKELGEIAKQNKNKKFDNIDISKILGTKRIE